jgi:hypothetical protein
LKNPESGLMKMMQYEENDGNKEVVSAAGGKKTSGRSNMKEYLEAKKKVKTAGTKKEGEVLAPGEVSEIERNFAKYFPKEML